MTDLLSSIDKAGIHAAFDDIHDTFARDITIYIAGDITYVDTDGKHNPIYEEQDSENITRPIITYSKKVRIKYLGAQDRIYGLGGSDAPIGVSFPKGTIRIKADQETYELITKAKNIKIDDRLCELIGAPARPGPFNPNYWTVELKQVD